MQIISSINCSDLLSLDFYHFRKEFQIYYQPIISLSTGNVSGFEALIRRQKDRMMFYPAEFMSDLERTGMIIPLGSWVLHETCRQVAMWQEQFSNTHLKASVNLS